MKSGKYSLTARLLHWVSAAIIVWATLTGFLLASLSAESALRATLSSLNVSLTTVFLPVFLFRMTYAAGMRKPPALDVPVTQRRAASFAHLLLYAVTTLVLFPGC